MVKIYTTLIVKVYKSFNQVPVNLRPEVKDELEALGLGTYGKPLAA